MDEEQLTTVSSDETAFSRQVGAQAARKLKARRRATRSIWFGFGMSGLVGWSVVVPTLIGVALGVWVDNHRPSQYSWTLMLMLIGLLIGCLNAWHWVSREVMALRDEQEDPDE
jgi:ATP synthase protein I